MSAGPHISISAETVLHLFNIPITNSILTSLVVSAILIIFALVAKKKLNMKDVFGRPATFQNFSEMVVEMFYNFVNSVTHNQKKTQVFLPFIASFFLWILLNNWLGLLPGVGTIGLTSEPESANLPSIEVQAQEVKSTADLIEIKVNEVDVAPEVVGTAPEGVGTEIITTQEEASEGEHEKTFIPILRAGTADINTTLALAMISVFFTQVFGFKYLGFGYFKKYLNFSSPIMFFVGLLELILEFAKVVSFAFRLFGNVFAGEVLLAVIMSLAPVIAPMPFYGMELFVGFIQALVFSMLTLVFFNMATISHDEH